MLSENVNSTSTQTRCPVTFTVLHTVIVVMHKANHVQLIRLSEFLSHEYQSSVTEKPGLPDTGMNGYGICNIRPFYLPTAIAEFWCRFWQPVQADSQPKSSGLVLGRWPLGAVLHSSNEPG